MTLTDKIMNKLFGPKHYRVKVSYQVNGRTIFDFTGSVAVWDTTSLENFKKLNKSISPLHKNNRLKQVRRYLKNGSITIEPTCYLGRWK